ncbi:MAG: nitroreductase family deazaflavin-dependent oxidoreductase [Ardenticatenaceae bacterium]
MSNVNDFNKQVIAEFRANEGKVGGYFANSTLLLLHTIGAKSGLERVNPLICAEDNNRLVIVASKGGAPSHPDWYYNLVANPEVTVEYRAEQFRVQATVTEEPERTRLYKKMEALFPGFTEYEKKTTRIIPVMTLTRLP